MTSANKARKAKNITSKEFGDFLNTKGINKECPECKDGDAALNVIKGNVGILNHPLVTVDSDGVFEDASPISLPTLSITCNNCGYTRNFSLSVVMDWIDEQQNKKDETNG